MSYFFMVAHKAACQTPSKAFLKSMKFGKGITSDYVHSFGHALLGGRIATVIGLFSPTPIRLVA